MTFYLAPGVKTRPLLCSVNQHSQSTIVWGSQPAQEHCESTNFEGLVCAAARGAWRDCAAAR